MKSTTVTVNGTVYDTRTGNPLRRERGTHAATTPKAAQHVHAQQQRSRTLNRRYVHREDIVRSSVVLTSESSSGATPKPIQERRVAHAITVHRRPNAPGRDIRHKQVTKYVKPSAGGHHTPSPTHKEDIAPTPHAIAIAADQRLKAFQQAHVPVAIKPSQVIKQESIKDALEKTIPKAHKKEVKQKKARSKTRQFASVASASLAIVLLGAYLTYLNMPSLSTRVAAAQAGVDASYPGYLPSGYSLTGPVAYQQGTVSMKFAANAGPRAYTLTQSESDWDSSAVLEKSVVPNSGSNYTTSTVSGLTIYTYGGVSTWVNNGVLYTITGNASLSNDQVQHIATSL